MKIIHSGPSNGLIKKLPKAPEYFDKNTKSNYLRIGQILISSQILKEKHLLTLVILAVEFSQFQYAITAINKENKKKIGSGFIQVFSTGAKNISAEVTLKQQAEKQIFVCLRRFGLDPKSEKELDISNDPNQTNLLDKLLGKKSI